MSHDVSEIGVPAWQAAVGQKFGHRGIHFARHDGDDLIGGFAAHAVDTHHRRHLKFQLVAQFQSNLIGLRKEHVVLGEYHGT